MSDRFAAPDRFAVIGASSFTGRVFVNMMRQYGHEIIELSRPEYDLDYPEEIAAKIIAVNASHVVNFAAINMVAESWMHFVDYYHINVIGIARLCDLMIGRKWNGRLVQVSTPEVYGSQSGIIKEGAPFRPSTPYAVSRAAIDMHLRALYTAFGFRVLFTRSVNVYGVGQQAYRLIPKTVLSIMRGEKLKLHGGGVSKRSWIHVHDAAEAIRRVALDGAEGEDYHVSGSPPIEIRDVVQRICKLMGTTFQASVEMDAERPGKDDCYLLDDSKIRAFGWQDVIGFNDGLANTVEWLKESKFSGSLEYAYAH